MQAMQAYAQRENDSAVNELMQRMYGDIYGEVNPGGAYSSGSSNASNYNASAFGVDGSLRCMVDNCSISPQSARTRQPHAMIPHHQHHHHHQHHTGVNHDASVQAFNSSYRSQEVHHSCDYCPLPPPGHHPMSAVYNNPQTMCCSHPPHTGPPVSHMHSSHTASVAPANNYNIPSGSMLPSTPAGPINNNPTPVPLNGYPATPVTTNCNTPIATVSHDNHSVGPILHSLWFLVLFLYYTFNRKYSYIR